MNHCYLPLPLLSLPLRLPPCLSFHVFSLLRLLLFLFFFAAGDAVMLMALRSWDKFISAAAAPFLLFDRRKPVLSLPKKKKTKTNYNRFMPKCFGRFCYAGRDSRGMCGRYCEMGWEFII